MARILVYTSPARGHLFPVLGIALELLRRGHAVHVCTLSGEIEQVQALALDARAIDHRIEARELDDWRAGNPMKALELAMRTFGDRAEYEVDDLRSAIAETSADALLVDTNSWGAQAAAEASGLPWATFQPYFTPLTGRGVPPFGPGFPLATGMFGRLRDRLLGRLVSRRMSALALPGVNEPRIRLGLAPLTSMDNFLTRPPRVIYFTVEALEYPRANWPESFRLVGPGTWSPKTEEPDWLADVEGPIVLATCSTERQEDRAILEAALEGLPKEGLFVVGTSAAFSPADVAAETHPQARVERFIPHDAILPRAAAVVCHGGMGITQRALAYGVPLVIVPFGRDQLEVARRVEHAGAGVRLSPKKLNAASLATAVRDARALEIGAQRIANAFSEAGGDGAAADALEELLREKASGAAREAN
ncbi:MAG: glycosyltransferase [Acidimicrobiia bacterium]|nr:glycosyltransferase [Acidimicrobiia bacterium]